MFGSSLGEKSKDYQVNNNEVVEATIKLQATLIKEATEYLLQNPRLALEYPLNFSISDFLHSRGIDVRFLYLLYRELFPDSDDHDAGDEEDDVGENHVKEEEREIPFLNWRAILEIEMVARAFKTMVKKSWRKIARKQKGRPSDNQCHEDVDSFTKRLASGNTWLAAEFLAQVCAVRFHLERFGRLVGWPDTRSGGEVWSPSEWWFYSTRPLQLQIARAYQQGRNFDNDDEQQQNGERFEHYTRQSQAEHSSHSGEP